MIWFKIRAPTSENGGKEEIEIFTQTEIMMLRERARHVLSESDTISLVAYLATLIQIEIAPNGVPKPINDGPRGRKPQDFGQFLGWEAFSSWLSAFSARLEGNKRRELIANLTSELPIKWHNRKQESLLAGAAREKSFLPKTRHSIERALCVCVSHLWSNNLLRFSCSERK